MSDDAEWDISTLWGYRRPTERDAPDPYPNGRASRYTPSIKPGLPAASAEYELRYGFWSDTYKTVRGFVKLEPPTPVVVEKPPEPAIIFVRDSIVGTNSLYELLKVCDDGGAIVVNHGEEQYLLAGTWELAC